MESTNPGRCIVPPASVALSIPNLNFCSLDTSSGAVHSQGCIRSAGSAPAQMYPHFPTPARVSPVKRFFSVIVSLSPLSHSSNSVGSEHGRINFSCPALCSDHRPEIGPKGNLILEEYVLPHLTKTTAGKLHQPIDIPPAADPVLATGMSIRSAPDCIPAGRLR